MRTNNSKKPKVFQMVDSLSMGGIERMSVNIANGLTEIGVESGLIVTRESGGLEEYLLPSVKKFIFKKKGKLDVFTFFKILSLLKKEAPDVLHIHQTSIFWGALLKKFLPKAKLIWHDHFGMSEQLDLHPRNEMDYLISSVDLIISVNEKIESYWKSRFPMMAESTYFIENFSGKLNAVPERKLNSTFKIINIANFRRQKDQLTLIRSLIGLKEKIGDFKVYLIGEFVEKDWLTEIKEEIEALGLLEQVEIVGPVVNVTPYIEMAHLGILSSESEGLPVALLEYGMGALPTIATNVGQCADVLGNGSLGELIPSKSREQLHKAILNVFNKYPQAIQRGYQFQEQTEANYGPSNFFKKYLPIALPEFEQKVANSQPL
ncbi:glycosyltransferase [Algoriphagus lutimaris]|uniref:glycosyltransferase n=1 Tax=Algoriphagus lutimaris TaxID=613197 RepID=UPI00196B013A|nr:glycosyltransferase [Algoriphagus lutimaris]MBN3518696.1 glycosyltransferase [Algoriphagus lutimaris]